MQKKLLVLVGTRPEVIKVAPLLRACRGRAFDTRLCTSGQHGALLTHALAEWGLTADVSFSLAGSLSEKSAACLRRLDAVLSREHPHALLVHGDTLTAFCGALGAFYRGVPVFHLEAGLRTETPFSPFPEELYRRTVDTVSTLCFAPTAHAAEVLLREGKPKEAVFTVGNTVTDGLWEQILPDFSHPYLEKEKKTVLLTVHRRESLGAPLRAICEGIRDALSVRKDTALLFPMHPNPAVAKEVLPILSGVRGVHILPPQSRRDFCNLLARATVVLTDSGGVEEEATALGVPTLVLREETERPEGVEAGVLFLVGRDRSAVCRALALHLDAPRPHSPSAVYGDGRAAERTAALIENFFLQKGLTHLGINANKKRKE